MIVRKLRALLRIGMESRLDDLSLGKSLLRAVLRREVDCASTFAQSNDCRVMAIARESFQHAQGNFTEHANVVE